MRNWLCFFLAVMWTAAGCAPTPKIGYDFDRSTDFSAYHTYAWMSGDQEKTGDRGYADSHRGGYTVTPERVSNVT